jgi:acyl-coenzyme A synthetase/AMP-(fatty) acid ligase/acyl carrier protein
MNFINEILRRKISENTAIVFGFEEISYRQLTENAFRFAFYIKEKGIDRVIIKTARSANAVTAALGVMFSGGIFAFLSDDLPNENIKQAADDLGNALIVDDNIDFAAIPPAPADFLPKLYGDDDPVCAVFTSGSTGRSKGTLLSYRALCNTVKWQTGYMKLPENSHTGAYASFGFIAAFWELWYPLASGFTLFIPSNEIRLDVFSLCKYINENEIAYIFLPSDVAEVFSGIYKGGSLRFLRVAGGRLGSCEKPQGYEILYSLGMCENAGSVTFLPITTARDGDIPIGKPFGDTEIYLIDGEMAVSGPSLFVGYANQKELTDKVLIDNPNASGRALYQKMYMSGDLAEIDSDGNFFYKGRRDWIVKINNIKTNPLESERIIRETDGVFEAAVVTFSRADNSVYLACFYTGEIEADSLRAVTSEKLPQNGVPSYFIKSDSLPKNSNGKIERKKLTMPESRKSQNNFSSEREKEIAAAFEKVLGLSSGSVGADDMFISLGGNSLGLMRLASELYKALGLSFRYADILSAQTPKKIALLTSDNENILPKTKLVYGKSYPLTAPERQMWLLHRTGQDNGRYTVRVQTDFDGEIDREKAENALTKLIAKNPILCSFYREFDTQPYHCYSDEKTGFSESEKSVFDLKKSPLFSAVLNENSLIFTSHHIIADAVSMRVLAEDFWAYYDGETPEYAAPFYDLSLSENHYSTEDELFWKGQLEGKTFTSLPVESESNIKKEFIVSLADDETNSLKNIALENSVTPFVVFTAAVSKLVTLIENAETVCIGVPVSGRDMPETARTIGMLVRTLPFLINKNDSIKTVNEKLKNAFLHQNYPFELMNEKFGARYDIMINYIPLPPSIKNAEKHRPRFIRGGYPAPAAKLVIDLREEENGFSAVFTYCAISEKIVENWAAALRSIIFNKPICDVIIPTENKIIEDEKTAINPDFAEIWKTVLGSETGSFYEAGGTSLKAIRIEEALLLRGFYLSAADILGIGDLKKLSGQIVSAEEIDWEAE